MAEPEVASTSSDAPSGRSRVKSRSVLTYFRDRWRSEVLHQPTASTDDRSAKQKTAVRRSHSQPSHKTAETVTGWRQSRRRQVSPPVRPFDRQDAGVQCAIVSWNALTHRFEMMADLPSPIDEAMFSSQEISLAATGTSRSRPRHRRRRRRRRTGTRCRPRRRASSFRCRRSPRRALAVHSAPPPDASQSMTALGCAAAEPRVGSSTRVAQLRRESADHATTARSSSCHSEPEAVRCCSATAAGMAVPRVDVAALRRQFRRRKAITLADFSAQPRFSRLSDSAAIESVSQRSAITQQR